MRKKRLAALTTLVLSATGGLPLAASAAADSSTLYVNNHGTCSDHAADSGSRADPFCTVSAAAAVVQPGQTVQIATGSYNESVDITRPGTPSAPITFVSPNWTNSEGMTTVGRIHLIGVHDVTVKNLEVRSAPEDNSVLVQNSSNITLDHLWAFSSGTSTNPPAIRITGQTDSVTVSRTYVSGSLGDGIAVEAGVTHTVLTTNPITNANGRGISVTDAPGTVITGNTVRAACGPAVELAGNSSGSTVENNVLMQGDLTNSSCTTAPLVDLQVSTASAAGTVADYNAINPKSQTPYNWAGQAEANVASFQTASHQGGHDVSWNGGYWGKPAEGSPLIDSADANAPGELGTDFFGHPRVDDPKVANTGTGVGYHDRGAFELQDPLSVGSISTPASTVPGHPLDLVLNATVTSPWSAATTTLDFGDGSAPVSQPAFPLTHTFPQPGWYTVTLTATDAQGTVRTSGVTAYVAPIGPIQPDLAVSTVRPTGGNPDLPLRVNAVTNGTGSPWPVAKETIDFGDGTVVNAALGSAGNQHDYAAPGTYTVTDTITDDHGRTGSTSRTITVGSDYVPLMSPTRILDTRSGLGSAAQPVGPAGVLKLQVAGRAGVPTDGKVTSVLLNLTATDATDSTYITAFPGGTVPTASNLNVTPGHDVGNAVLVPVAPDGTISLYNHVGNVDLVADVQGYYSTQPPANGMRVDYQVAPSRALDTRSGIGGVNGTVGPGATIRFQVRGQGQLPQDAQVAVLNLTATDGTDSSYVTAAPNGTPPTNSSINFGPGQTVANQVTVPINPDGTVTLYNHTGTVNLIADIQGGYSNSTSAGSSMVTIAPTRVLDTRSGIGGSNQPLGPNSTVKVKVAGVAGVPVGVGAVVVNLTATNPTDTSWLNAYDSGSTVRSTSNINVTPNATVPNLALVPVGSDGCIEIYNHTGSTDVIVDLQGYVW